MNGRHDRGRRPIADFLSYAREQPNAALGAGLGIVVLVAVVGFGIFHFTGGSSDSGASASPSGGAQISGEPTSPDSSSASPGSTAKGGSRSATTRTTAKGSAATSRTSPPAGGTDGSGQPVAPTPPTAPPKLPPIALTASQQRWVASPANVHMKAGANTRGWVIVTNLSTRDGIITAPGCSSGPAPVAVAPMAVAQPRVSAGFTPAAAPAPCKAPRQVVVPARRYQKFVWTWHATQSGRAGAPPLAPGTYAFTIGPVTVHVTVR